MASSSRRWTLKEDDHLRELLLINTSSYVIATQLDRSVSEVRKRARLFRVRRPVSPSDLIAKVLLIAGMAIIWGGMAALAATYFLAIKVKPITRLFAYVSLILMIA